MREPGLEVHTGPDGCVTLRPHGTLDVDDAVELQQAIVHTVRRVRPFRMVLDLGAVPALDPVNLGTLAATCALADYYSVLLFLDNPTPRITEQLLAAGVPRQRLR